MKCDRCNQETNGNVLCPACSELIPHFNPAAATYGTELARALAAELAPYLYEE
jgi:hypothetical protein